MSVHIHHLTAPSGDGKPVDLKKVLAKLKQSKVVEGINKVPFFTPLFIHGQAVLIHSSKSGR